MKLQNISHILGSQAYSCCIAPKICQRHNVMQASLIIASKWFFKIRLHCPRYQEWQVLNEDGIKNDNHIISYLFPYKSCL